MRRSGSGRPSKSRNGWNSRISRPASRMIRPISFGLRASAMKSCSKISMPSKPAVAMASSFSCRVPDTDTVAIDVRMIPLLQSSSRISSTAPDTKLSPISNRRKVASGSRRNTLSPSWKKLSDTGSATAMPSNTSDV